MSKKEDIINSYLFFKRKMSNNSNANNNDLNLEIDKIHFFTTGGTIDSYFCTSKDGVVPFKDSIIPQYFLRIKSELKIKFTKICSKDSRDLTIEDLKKLVNEVENSNCQKIIITHGTFTMVDTARFLRANLKRKDQTIIFTAAMIPISEFVQSDGTFNLGFSSSAVQFYKPGIYICMHGEIFDPEEVLKFLNEGKFSSIFSAKWEEKEVRKKD